MEIVRKIIRESVNKILDEDALRFSHLTDGTGLFVKEINSGYDMTLYNPKTKDVYAYIGIVLREEANDYFVSGVAAKYGFGPFIYELAMMHIYKEGKGLMPTRDGDIRGDAWNVWEKFFKTRPDVKKKTLDITNSTFNFNIIDDIYWYDNEEKKEIFDNLEEEDKEGVIMFNTVYFLKPNQDYSKLIKIANKWENKGFDKNIAAEAGDALWAEKYGL